MPRSLRIEAVGLTYHVWASGIAGLQLFRGATERDIALRLLREEVELSRWTCLEYVVMTTHYHLVLRLNKPTLSSGLQRFNTRFAQWFNQANGRRGHVFSGRFGMRIVESTADELEVARYVALNPSRAQMCRLPEHYPWCAYGAIIGLYPPDPIVDVNAALAPIGGSRRAYRAFVEEFDPRVRRAQLESSATGRRGQTRARPQMARAGA
jgi:REP-associated tyrosine transposase